MPEEITLNHRHVPLRDLRRTMVVPFFCVDNRRTEKIIFSRMMANKLVHCEVIPGQGDSVPTIFDLDILIGLVSIANDIHQEKQLWGTRLSFAPALLLTTIRRHSSGADYARLAKSIRRLTTCTIITNVYEENGIGMQEPFSWIVDYQIPTRYVGEFEEAESSVRRNWSVTLSPKAAELILAKTELLSLPASYFGIRSGVARALYRIARKSVPKEKGWWLFRLETLYSYCAIRSPISKFKANIEKTASKGLPGYSIELLEQENGTAVMFKLDRSFSSAQRGVCEEGNTLDLMLE